MPAPVIDLTGDTPPPRRQTRSSTRSQLQALASRPSPQSSTSASTHISLIPTSSASHDSDFQISPIPWSLRSPPNSPLLRKRAWLRSHSISLPPGLSRRSFSGFSSGSDPIGATLVFAQEEAGTAVCVSPDGVLLTCAHCIAEDPAELDPARLHPLVFSSGAVVTARVAAWDPTRDLALLVIAEVEVEPEQAQGAAADHPQQQRDRGASPHVLDLLGPQRCRPYRQADG